jgi:4-hydroxyphenylpyruvate dioxygenase-like putative hemolysin
MVPCGRGDTADFYECQKMKSRRGARQGFGGLHFQAVFTDAQQEQASATELPEVR